jgi:hypothetical protein
MTARSLARPLLLAGVLAIPVEGPEAPGTRVALDCRAPLRWTIEAVDPRFGLTDLQAADAVRQAGMVWSEPLGRPLLFQESADGVAIRFVFDERMETALERHRRVAEVDETARAIEERSAALEARRVELARRRASHDARALDFEERQESYNRTVENWNRAGGAPPSELERLRAMEAEIAELRRAVDAEAEEINRMVDEVNRDAEALNAGIEDLNRARVALADDFPARVVESAEYRQSRGGLFSNASREIDVFHFEDRDHLVRVLAHVLGHAIGLEHSTSAGSLMHEAGTASEAAGSARATEEDLTQLRTLCPEL